MATIKETKRTLEHLIEERSSLIKKRERLLKLSRIKNVEGWGDIKSYLDLIVKDSSVRILNVIHDDSLDDHQSRAKQNYHKGFQDCAATFVRIVEDETQLMNCDAAINIAENRITALHEMEKEGNLPD